MAKLYKEAAMVNNNARIIAESMGSSDEDDVIMDRIDYLVENFDYRHPRSLDQLGVILEAIQIDPNRLMGWLGSLGVPQDYLAQVQELLPQSGAIPGGSLTQIDKAIKMAGGKSRERPKKPGAERGPRGKDVNPKSTHGFDQNPDFSAPLELEPEAEEPEAEEPEAEEPQPDLGDELLKKQSAANQKKQQAPQRQDARQAKWGDGALGQDPRNLGAGQQAPQRQDTRQAKPQTRTQRQQATRAEGDAFMGSEEGKEYAYKNQKASPAQPKKKMRRSKNDPRPSLAKNRGQAKAKKMRDRWKQNPQAAQPERAQPERAQPEQAQPEQAQPEQAQPKKKMRRSKNDPRPSLAKNRGQAKAKKMRDRWK